MKDGVCENKTKAITTKKETNTAVPSNAELPKNPLQNTLNSFTAHTLALTGKKSL